MSTTHTAIRCFIALPLPEQTKKALITIQKTLQKNGAHARWVHPDNMHLTLRFLGERSPKNLKKICYHFPSFFEGLSSFKITLDGMEAFPDKEEPRVIWTNISDDTDTLTSLYDRVNDHLSLLGIPKLRKQFIPHLTLARCKTRQESLSSAQAIKKYRFCPFDLNLDRVNFLESILSAGHPTHKTLLTYRLSAYLKNKKS